MEFIYAIRSAFSQCWRFSGRASRSEFWYYVAFVYLVDRFCSYILADFNLSTQYTDIFLPVILYIPQIALSVRRLHDSNRSGYWFFGLSVFYSLSIYYGKPILSLLNIRMYLPENELLLALIGSLAALILLSPILTLMAFFLKVSDPHENRYGLPPQRITSVWNARVTLVLISSAVFFATFFLKHTSL